MSKLEPHQYRRIDETLAQWANRLREERGGHSKGLEWHEAAGGELRLRSARAVQKPMNFT